MNVLIVNTYFWGGGAEKISRQLYYGLKEKGIHTFFMSGRLQPDVPEDVDIIYKSFLSRCITTGSGMLFHNTLFRTVIAKRKIIECIKKNKIDIVHFHNIHSNYLGIQDIEEIARYCKGVVFTLHDMWLLTGCCAYALECTEWRKSSCKMCRGNMAMKKRAISAEGILKIKRTALEGKEYHFVVPAEWLYNQCQSSYLKNEDIKIVQNGIDLMNFRYQDKKKVREKYHINSEKNILLFAANGVTNIYKGFAYLYEALQIIENKEDYVLLVVGNKSRLEWDIGYEIHEFGYIKNPEIMNEIYGIADVFVMPSIAEIFPLASLEAMASGTPVVAFNAGGLGEQITPETGWIVEKRNSQALGDTIQEIFEHKQVLRQKAINALRRVEELYSEQRMLDEYISLYEDILGDDLEKRNENA